MSHFPLRFHITQRRTVRKKIRAKELSSTRLSRSLRPRRRRIRRRPCRTLNAFACVRASVFVCVHRKKGGEETTVFTHTHTARKGRKEENEGPRRKRNNKQRNKTTGHSRVFLHEGHRSSRDTTTSSSSSSASSLVRTITFLFDTHILSHTSPESGEDSCELAASERASTAELSGDAR